MNPKPRKHLTGARYVALASLASLALGAALLLVLYFQICYYLPLALIGLLLLLPVAINLLLLIPRGKQTFPPPSKEVEAEEEGEDAEPQDKKGARAVARLAAWAKRAMLSLKGFFSKNRTVLISAAMIAVTVVTGVLFFTLARGASHASKLNYLILVLLGALFVIFIVLGKWCKHRKPVFDEKCEDVENVRYDIALLRNLQSAFLLGRIALVPIIFSVWISLIGFYDFSKWVIVILSVFFVYKAVFILISLFVVLVRREFAIAPEIAAPAPGVEGGDLGILTYLEKNTGISMRSLWSMQMIKRALPYALLLGVVLLWCVTGVVLVGSNQEGAHYRFGKLQDDTLSPGLHFTLPWPFDKVEVYDTKTVSKMTVGYIAEEDADNIWTEAHGGEEYRLLLGGGNELVSINLRVMYRIGDLRAYLTNNANPELLMSSASYEIVTARTITRDLDTMLAADRAVFAESFREELSAYMQQYNTGIEIVSVVLESIHPPVEIADAYQALISAEIEAQKMILEAQGYAIQRVSFAYVQSDNEKALANIDYYNSVSSARAAVAEFMASVEADNAYSSEYRYYKYMQAITEAYSDAKLIIVGEGVNAENIYIGSLGSGAAK